MLSSSSQFGMVIVVDQMRHDYLSEALMPNLCNLKDESSYFGSTRIRHISAQTSVGHATIATGTLSHKHGVIGNKWINGNMPFVVADEVRSRHNIPHCLSNINTLGDKAVAKGFYVMSITGKNYSAALFAGSQSHFIVYPALVQTIYVYDQYGFKEKYVFEMQDLDGYNIHFYPSPIRTKPIRPYDFPDLMEFDRVVYEASMKALDYLIRNSLERWLLLISFSSTDKAGHVYGPFSDQVKACLRAVDTYIKNIYDLIKAKGLLKRTLILVTSDHGAKNVTGAIRLLDRVALKKLKGPPENYIEFTREDRIIKLDLPDDVMNNIILANNDLAYLKILDRSRVNIILQQISDIPYLRCVKYLQDGSIKTNGAYPSCCKRYINDVDLGQILNNQRSSGIVLIPEEGFTILSPLENYKQLGTHGSCYPAEDNLCVPLVILGSQVPVELVPPYQDEIAKMLEKYLGIGRL